MSPTGQTASSIDADAATRDRERRGVDPQAERVLDVGPVAEREACRHERGGSRRHDRRHRLEPDGVASGRDGDDYQDDREQREGVVEDVPQRVEPVREAREEPDERPLEARRRVDGDQCREPDQGGNEQEDVGRAPEAGLAAGGREDPGTGAR